MAIIDLEQQALIHIPSGRMSAFRKKLGKVNTKAVKWGLEEIKYIDLGVYPQQHTHTSIVEGEQFTRNILVDCHRIQLINPIPRISGWTLAAKLEDREGDGVPVPSLIKEMQQPRLLELIENATAITCEHCNHNRRRKTSYVLFNAEQDAYKAVGSTCVQDFLGDIRPAAFEKWFGLMAEVVYFGDLDLRDSLADYEFSYTVQEIIAESLAQVEKCGRYVSQTLAEEQSMKAQYGETFTGAYTISTTQLVRDALTDVRGEKLTNSDHMFKAQEIINWFKEFATTDAYDRENDWQFRLVQIITKKETSSNIGLVASAVCLYNIMNPVKDDTVSEHVGNVKERRDFTLILNRRSVTSGPYGDSYIYFCKDEDGNSINITSTKYFAWEPNETKTFKATVKNHSDHPKFGKSTWVTRAKEV